MGTHDTSFEAFHKKMGFVEYPFEDKTAEKEDTKALFINPTNYASLENSFIKGQTIIINGNRGNGKTIIEEELKRKTKKDKLICYISNYESVRLENNICDFYSLILQEITRALTIHLYKNKRILKKMKRDDKLFVSFLLKKYGDIITDSQLKKQMEEIQLNGFQRVINFVSAPLTRVLNYGATAVTNFGNQLLSKEFGQYLPSVSQEEIKDIFPDISFAIESDFHSIEISYSLFRSSMEKIHGIVGNKPIVLFDRFDEDSRIENDAEVLSSFLKELLSDNNLLLNNDIQLIIAVWTIAFEQLASVFRRSKHYVFDINWEKKHLLEVLDKRIITFSRGSVLRWEQMFDDTSKIDEIILLANSNPRDLWDLLDHIIHAQYDIDEQSTTISNQAIEIGKRNFVSNFNFYEYYPRKKSARKNTNDIYSYIKHLLALDNTDEFTNEELKNKANTGGSTTNYITQMMSIGLVVKTSQKRAGGAVIYKIKDPKVVYAIMNKIDIEK